jgi:hypothetical protein
MRDDLADLAHEGGCLWLCEGRSFLQRFAEVSVERTLHEGVEVE